MNYLVLLLKITHQFKQKMDLIILYLFFDQYQNDKFLSEKDRRLFDRLVYNITTAQNSQSFDILIHHCQALE